jgi:TolB protein
VTSNCGFCISPVYLPPKPGFLRNAFFFVSYKIGQPKIYIGSLKGGEPQRFISLKGNQLTPSVSLQRDKMAFVCDYTNNPDLFLQAFDVESGPKDKPQQIFAVPHGTQGSPALSPDGKRVAFVSNKDGSPRIYVMDIPAPGAKLKDIKPILISKYNRESSAPSWSPDGSKIVYCASTDGVRQIWMYDFKKNEEKQLTKGKGNKENPAWGPNSLHIVYNSTGSEGSELYLMNLNQTEATRISQGKGEKHFPNWEIPSR